MKLLVNGFSAIGATSKEQAVALTLQAVKDNGYMVVGQPVIKKRSYYNEYRVYIPAISKSSNNPVYCVRTFKEIDTEEVATVPFVDLTVCRSYR